MKEYLKAFLLLLISLIISVTMISCGDGSGGGDGDDSGEPSDGGGDTLDYYTVSVVDYKGDAVPNIIVRLLLADGSSFKAQPVGVSGEKVPGRADFTDVNSGSYTVDLMSTSPSKTFEFSKVTVNESNKHVTVIVLNSLGEENYQIYGENIAPETFVSTVVGSGGYSVGVVDGITYFVFFADNKGVYELSVDGGTIGYYGAPLNVFSASIAGDDDKFFVLSDTKLKIEIPDVNTPHVIGIAADEAGRVSLKAEMVSALPNRPEYQEWYAVGAKSELEQFVLDRTSYSLVEIDVKSRSLSVSLGEDGYYYTSDGNLVVVHINTASQYLEAPAVMAGILNENIGGNFGGYVYDDNGNFLRKEAYNEMIADYSAVADEKSGVYPLTEELANVIKSVGDFRGWWSGGAANVFGDEIKHLVNEDIAWLLLCAYLEPK